jgi:hypothetical protein
MRATSFFIGVLMIVGLLSLGAGASPTDAAESPADEAAVVWCSNKSWLVNFYAEPELINVVGWLRCQCFRQQTGAGQQTNYAALISERVCSLD